MTFIHGLCLLIAFGPMVAGRSFPGFREELRSPRTTMMPELVVLEQSVVAVLIQRVGTDHGDLVKELADQLWIEDRESLRRFEAEAAATLCTKAVRRLMLAEERRALDRHDTFWSDVRMCVPAAIRPAVEDLRMAAARRRMLESPFELNEWYPAGIDVALFVEQDPTTTGLLRRTAADEAQSGGPIRTILESYKADIDKWISASRSELQRIREDLIDLEPHDQRYGALAIRRFTLERAGYGRGYKAVCDLRNELSRELGELEAALWADRFLRASTSFYFGRLLPREAALFDPVVNGSAGEDPIAKAALVALLDARWLAAKRLRRVIENHVDRGGDMATLCEDVSVMDEIEAIRRALDKATGSPTRPASSTQREQQLPRWPALVPVDLERVEPAGRAAEPAH
jgi:hypothetical protein